MDHTKEALSVGTYILLEQFNLKLFPKMSKFEKYDYYELEISPDDLRDWLLNPAIPIA